MIEKKILATGLSREVLPINEERETVLNQPSKQVQRLPFYNLLPRDFIGLLKWRIYVRKRCLVDREFRDDIWEMCRQDVAFFANTFCILFEPRPPAGPASIVCNLWPDQADCLVWMDECFGYRDCGVEKTRGIGMTWTVSILMYHKLLFWRECKMAMSTKDEATLDGVDSNFLMGKITHLHEHMPAWVRYDEGGRETLTHTTSNHLIVYWPQKSTVQGFSPTDAKRRSMRFTASFDDEFAYYPRDVQEALNTSGGTTNSRFFVSTWHGHDNEFHRMMRVQKTTMLRIRTYWWNNPERWQGCYQSVKGVIQYIDKDYPHPPDYPFEHDGLMRSPWVDAELRRVGASSDIQTALEEFYGLQAEAGRKFFRNDTVDFVTSSVRPPMRLGDVDNSGSDLKFRTTYEGPLKLWADLGDGRGGPYGAGCDLAWGRGASYSALQVIDLSTGLQVLEYSDNTIDPVAFANYVVTVLRWLNGRKGDGHCYLNFENNGAQGVAFGVEAARLGYGNIYQRHYRGKTRDQQETYLGMRNGDGGIAIFGAMERAIRDGELVVSSADVLHEIETFDKDEKGKPEYPRGLGGHGDCVHALALAWHVGKERRDNQPTQQESRLDAIKRELQPEPEKRRRWGSAWRVKRQPTGW